MTELLNAYQAMAYAQKVAIAGDFESARFWLDFARELRQGSVPGVQAASVADETRRLQMPVQRPGEAIEGDGELCRHCGYFIKRAPLEESKTGYVHTRTGLAMCTALTVEGDGNQQTFVHRLAQPEMTV